jgi:hypothetical protein
MNFNASIEQMSSLITSRNVFNQVWITSPALQGLIDQKCSTLLFYSHAVQSFQDSDIIR